VSDFQQRVLDSGRAILYVMILKNVWSRKGLARYAKGLHEMTHCNFLCCIRIWRSECHFLLELKNFPRSLHVLGWSVLENGLVGNRVASPDDLEHLSHSPREAGDGIGLVVIFLRG